MKKIYSIILGLLFILNINEIHSQEATNDTIVPVSLEGVVVSTPFNESLENNVISVDKVNLGDLSFLKSQSNPKALYNGEWIELQPLGTEGQGTSLTSQKKYSLNQIEN